MHLTPRSSGVDATDDEIDSAVVARTRVSDVLREEALLRVPRESMKDVDSIDQDGGLTMSYVGGTEGLPYAVGR